MANPWRRTFGPRLEKTFLRSATFQLLRKTNTTLCQKAGVDTKVSADQRGKGGVYDFCRQQKCEAVKKLESAVTRIPPRWLSA
jgi:hypothetical protein